MQTKIAWHQWLKSYRASLRTTFVQMSFLVKIPKFVSWFYPSLVWRIRTSEKIVFLTFDDGPTPEITDWVCQQLAAFDFKATFFLIGNNVEKHPEIAEKLRKAGHSIGNHTHNHMRGWGSKTPSYVADVQRAAPQTSSQLFRPPYGRITKNQISALKTQYKIVMWDVLSYDYDKRVSPEQCTKNVIENLEPGSIIVFHDSKKAWPNLQIALPKVLLYLKQNKYVSRTLDY